MTAFSTIEAASVTISHDDALRALTNASKAIDKKAEVEILYAAVVRSAPGGIAISATSLDLTSTTFIRCQAPKGFLAVFDCQTGLNLLKKAKKSDEVTFTMLEHGCQVSIGKLNVKLNEVANRDEELPSINDTEIRQLNQYFTIPSAQLLKIIEKVSFAISTEESRYYLNGIYMCPTTDGETSGMDFVATDGHRLSRFSIELPEGAEGLEGVIIPLKAVKELHRLLKRKECPENVAIRATDDLVQFELDTEETLLTKLVDGTFPDYSRVIPTKPAMTASACPRAMADAIKQVTSIAVEKGKAVKLTFAPGELTFTLDEVSAGSAEMTIRSDNEIDFVIGVNPSYMLDMFGQIEGHVEFGLIDEGSPMLIRDLANPEVTMVQMPKRL